MYPKKPAVHFTGIGGIGMSGLARWFLAQKWAVSGSDIQKSQITEELRKSGIRVKIGHKKANLPSKAQKVIYNLAIPASNPELTEARQRKLAVLSYPQALGRLTESYTALAVAGSHGKSTTTALAAMLFVKAGLDPTVILGTKLKEFKNSNFRPGRSKYLILEADEYGRAFWNYSPTLAIVTNIDREHLDVYKNLAGVKNGFLKFISRVKSGGYLILNRDDKNLLSLKDRISKLTSPKNIRILWYSSRQPAAKRVRRSLRLPGRHNLANAMAVYALGRVMRLPEKTILKALRDYRGSWRRMEYRGTFHVPRSTFHIAVYDDYAHHPTEVKATLGAFREKYPKHKIICVFQPHQAERLKALFQDFQTAFDAADVTLILPIYQVAGRDKPIPKFDSQSLVRAIQKKQPKKLIFYLADPKNLKKALITLLQPLLAEPYTLSPVLIMMGAGDIINYTDSLIHRK